MKTKRKCSIVLALSLVLASISLPSASVEAKSVTEVKTKVETSKDAKKAAKKSDKKLEKKADKKASKKAKKVKKTKKKKVKKNQYGEKEINILATSDLHGRLYPHDYAVDEEDPDAGLAKVAAIVKEEREKDSKLILMDCGDTVQDNSAELFNDMEVHPMIECMNDLKYDIWTIGNHEFNFSMPFLNRNIKGFKGTVLSSNIYNKDSKKRFVDGYKIFNIKGVRVAVVGMTPPYIPIWEASSPAHFEGLEFEDATKETKKVIEELDGKYDVLVGAYHIGPDGERGGDGIEKIAAECPEFDVIFGGHAHSRYQKDITVGEKTIPLVEPGAYGWAVSKATIKVDKTKEGVKILSAKAENILTETKTADQDVLDKYAYVHKKSVEDANMIVGQVTDDFIKRVDYITGADKVTTMPTVQIEDTALLDLINKVQLYYTKAEISSVAAFKNEMNLKKGDFKKKDVANIYKFPNTLVGVNITGANLKKFMEFCARYYNQYKPGDVTVSFNKDIRGYMYDMFAGINYDIDISKPEGQRIINPTINGKPIEDTKTYKLAVNNYRLGTLTENGFATIKDVYYDSYEKYQDAGRIRDLIMDYVKTVANGKISPEVDNNWKIVGAPDLNHPRKAEVYKLIQEGKIQIPRSEDGRTPNVKSVNINDLIKEGLISAAIKEIIKFAA